MDAAFPIQGADESSDGCVISEPGRENLLSSTSEEVRKVMTGAVVGSAGRQPANVRADM